MKNDNAVDPLKPWHQGKILTLAEKHNKKNIIFLLFSLFICLSVSAFAGRADRKPLEHQGTISQNKPRLVDEHVFSLEGILQPSVKVNESNSPTFQNFKTGKRNFSLAFSCFSTAPSRSFYDSYLLLRVNRVSVSPFYIAYHCLII